MKASLLIAAGFILGFGAASLIFLSRRAPDPRRPEPVAKTPEKPADAPPVKEPEKKEPAPKPVEPEKPVPKPEPPKEADPNIAALFMKLSKMGFSAFNSKEMGELLEALRKAGKDGLDFAIDRLLKAPTANERFLAGAFLESLKDPAALPALAQALSKDTDGLVRRMASHAMAVIGTDAALDGLRTAMQTDKDWGVRANSAYGLAKLGQEDGLKILEGFYTSPDSTKEQKMAAFGGLADVAHPTSAPLFRELLTSTEMSYLLVAIKTLEKMKDTASLPELQKLANSAEEESVREAAAKAIEAIQK
jgi:hypothetical protein